MIFLFKFKLMTNYFFNYNQINIINLFDYINKDDYYNN